MITENLKTIFNRDLNRLKIEIAAYQDEAQLWKISGDIKNSAGNLCLHLIGNLNTYIGAELGKSGYIRNRELEFSLKDIPKSELLMMIDQTIKVVDKSLSLISDEDLSREYPVLVFESKASIGFFLIHLTTHLTYHLGQINYHRRLLAK
ncbi:DinB family protein [Pedobacter polaris]|uniref:DinB family protein n=1 Tax=Pedobacter polaris TaxID=2571273 RepID=A0A4U1CHU8_9SPHI|nr:DinB family protein [Pedobacter polaris]TKC05530.1 DinB family protein [Pedobacter polaris]